MSLSWLCSCSSETHLVKNTAGDGGQTNKQTNKHSSATESTNSIVVTCSSSFFFYKITGCLILNKNSSFIPPRPPRLSVCLPSVSLSSLCLPSRQACFMLCRMFIIRQHCPRGLSILSIKKKEKRKTRLVTLLHIV